MSGTTPTPDVEAPPATPLAATGNPASVPPPVLGGSRFGVPRGATSITYSSPSTPRPRPIESLRRSSFGTAPLVARQLGTQGRQRFNISSATSLVSTPVQAPAPAPTPATAPPQAPAANVSGVPAGANAPTGGVFSAYPLGGNPSAAAGPLIDGVTLSLNPLPNTSFLRSQILKLQDKTLRGQLPLDELAIVHRESSKRIIDSKHLIGVPVYDSDGTRMLQAIVRVTADTEKMRMHIDMNDIADGLVIVFPVSCQTCPDLRPERLNLFEDFSRITLDDVILSTMWYRMWAAEKFVPESMTLLYRFIQNNVDAELWSKCHEDLLSVPVACQTGPVMMFLVLKRIYNCSESTLDLLLQKLKALKINKEAGEDVESIVRTINVITTLLYNSSNKDRNYITHDFARDVLRVFQTSSVPEFNDIFLDIERRCQVEADSSGQSIVSWPSVESTTRLGITTYRRMLTTGLWLKAPAPAGFSAGLPGWKPGNCFNCGSDQHMAGDCPEPVNQETIEANKQVLAEWRKLHPKKPYHGRGGGSGRGGRGRGRGRGRGSGSAGNGKPHKKLASDGKPLKLNAQGNYVLDQARWHTMQHEQAVDRLTALFAAPGAGAPPPATPAPATAAVPAAPAASAASVDRAARIREAVEQCFS